METKADVRLELGIETAEISADKTNTKCIV